MPTQTVLLTAQRSQTNNGSGAEPTTSGSIKVGLEFDANLSACLQFAMPSLPANAVVSSAVLSMIGTSFNQYGSHSGTLGIIANDLPLASQTLSTMPLTAIQAFHDPNFPSPPAGSVLIGGVATYTFDLTSQFNTARAAGHVTNHLLVGLKHGATANLTDASGGGGYLSSHQAFNGADVNVSSRSFITIDYTIPTEGLGSETVWICPTLDDAGNGTASVNAIGPTTHSGTLTDMVPASDWVADTAFDGVRAIDFDGLNDRIITTWEPDDLTSLSGGCWIKTTDTSSSVTVLGNDEVPGTRGWALRLQAGYLEWFSSPNGAVTAFHRRLSSQFLASGYWYHIGFTFDGGVIKLFIDGAEVATTSTGSGSPAGIANGAGNAVVIGSRFGAQQQAFTRATLDDIRLSTTVWNADDFALLATRRGVLKPFASQSVAASVTLGGVAASGTVDAQTRATGSVQLDGMTATAAVDATASASSTIALYGVVVSTQLDAGNVSAASGHITLGGVVATGTMVGQLQSSIDLGLFPNDLFPSPLFAPELA